jgi:hypothetical protein
VEASVNNPALAGSQRLHRPLKWFCQSISQSVDQRIQPAALGSYCAQSALCRSRLIVHRGIPVFHAAWDKSKALKVQS